MHQTAETSLGQRLSYVPEVELEPTRLAAVLRELYDLLEQYAPAWYTEEHHERAESALRIAGGAGHGRSNQARRGNGRADHRSNL